MALHQFKTKHNSMCKASSSSIDDFTVGNANESLHLEPQNGRIQNRPNNPILLYSPEEVMCHSVQHQNHEDLFSACHKDLLQENSLNPNLYSNEYIGQNQSSPPLNLNIDRLPNRAMDDPYPNTEQDCTNQIRHTSKVPKKKSSWSVRKNRYTMGLPNTSYKLSPKENLRTHQSPWEQESTLQSQEDQFQGGSPNVENLQEIYRQLASRMQCPTRQEIPVTMLTQHERLQVNMLTGQHDYRHLSKSYPTTGQPYSMPCHESYNSRSMLAEGLKLACDEARETLSRMERERDRSYVYQSFDMQQSADAPEFNGGDLTDKMNYIQSIILQLADCSDPEILSEARRIIPVDLLQRLLQQVQDGSSGIQDHDRFSRS